MVSNTGFTLPPEQAEILNKTFGCTRFIYNHGLEYRTKSWKDEQKNISTIDSIKKLKQWKQDPELQWLNEPSSVTLQQALRQLGEAFERFFKGQAKYPKFKVKGRCTDSATYMTNAFEFTQSSPTRGILKLAKMDEPLDVRWTSKVLPVEAQPSSVTISRDKAGRYFVSLSMEEDIQEYPEAENDVRALDIGLTHYIVDDEGNKVEPLKALAKYEKRLARAQKDLSRKKKGSKNRAKARLKVAKLHARITDARRDFLQQLSTQIMRDNQIVIVETLRVKNMLKNHSLAKHIQDASWGAFVSMLEYKAQWYGRELIKIDQWYASTQTCSNCEFKNQELTLEDRMWTCPCCWTLHDRDVNAAVNIKKEGLRLRTAGLAGIACILETECCSHSGSNGDNVSGVVERTPVPLTSPVAVESGSRTLHTGEGGGCRLAYDRVSH